MTIRRQKGFTLVEMLVVIAIIAILAAALFPAIQSAIDQARATAMKNKGRGVWVAIISSNMEREPLEKGPLWPYEFKLPVAQGGEGQTYTGAAEYFKKLMEGDRPEDQLVTDLKPEMLAASGFPSAGSASALGANNVAWRVAEVSDSFASGDAFMMSKDLGSVSTSGASNDVITLVANGPFKGRRIVWVTRGGGLYDARKKYARDWSTFFKLTNNVPMLAD
jgi:prepilin-type N-terminal cleavage/methylation domain-containing protein